MTIRLLDPVGEAPLQQQLAERTVNLGTQARVAYVFNRYVSCLDYWAALEAEIAARWNPGEAHRLYKSSHTAAADPGEIAALAHAADCAIVGVGA